MTQGATNSQSFSKGPYTVSSRFHRVNSAVDEILEEENLPPNPGMDGTAGAPFRTRCVLQWCHSNSAECASWTRSCWCYLNLKNVTGVCSGIQNGPSLPTSFAGLLPKGSGASGHCSRGQDSLGTKRKLKTFEDVRKSNVDLRAIGSSDDHTNSAKRRYDVGSNASLSSRGVVADFGSLPHLPQMQGNNGVKNDKGERVEVSNTLPGPSILPPVDLTPCQRIRMIAMDSNASEVVSEMKHMPKRDLVDAESKSDDFFMIRTKHMEDGTLWMSRGQQLASALVTWRFPESQWKPHVMKNMPQDVKLERRNAWCEAFCSTYDSFRCGTCSMFFVSSPTQQKGRSSHVEYTVMFTNKNVSSVHARICAVLSRSTPGLRSMLQKSGVGFESPLLSLPSKDHGSSRSILVFEGAIRVHGLFDFLLNKSHNLSHEDCDVPVIHAPIPFARATFQRLAIQVVGRGNDSKGTIGTDYSGAENRNKFTVLECSSDFIPPWVAQKLFLVLTSPLQQHARILLSPVPHAVSMNYITRCDDKEDDESFMRGRSLEEMTYCDGKFCPTRATPVLLST